MAPNMVKNKRNVEENLRKSDVLIGFIGDKITARKAIEEPYSERYSVSEEQNGRDGSQ